MIKYLQDPIEEDTPGLLELSPNKLALSLIISKLALQFGAGTWINSDAVN